MTDKYCRGFIASGNVQSFPVSPCLLLRLAILVIVGLIGAGACYSRTLSNETSYKISHEGSSRVEQEHTGSQTQMDHAGTRLKGLPSPVTVFVAGGLVHSLGTLLSLTNASVEARSDSASATPRKEMPALLATLNSLSIVPSVWPVLGRVTGLFGKRRDPFNGESAFHAGLDIASHYGDTIRATADGIVTKAQSGGSYGLLVVIDHGFGVASWYGHLSKLVAAVGTRVKRGEVIGYEGHSGRATGTHLHYELRIDNTPVDPGRFLGNSRLTAAGDRIGSVAIASTYLPSEYSETGRLR